MAGSEIEPKDLAPYPFEATDEMVNAWSNNPNQKDGEISIIIRYFNKFTSCGPKTVFLTVPLNIYFCDLMDGKLSHDEKVLTFKDKKGELHSVNPIVISAEQAQKLKDESYKLIPRSRRRSRFFQSWLSQ